MTTMRPLYHLLALIALPAAVLGAQSNLSGQGFGFPTGQLSTRAYGAGGSLAEMDPLSPVNPASIAVIGSRILFFQLEPEFRTVTTANGSEGTTTARYPVVLAAIPVSGTWVVSLSSSTLLDRTSSTSFTTTQLITPIDSVAMTTTFKIDGAMDDIRLATAWTPANWLRLGVGVHAIAGHNLISVAQSFADSSQFSAFTQQRTLGFSGLAGSAGIQLVSKSVVASASGRLGGTLRLSSSDSILTTAKVPNRFGASIAYIGIANSAIAIRTSHDSWSALGSLGTPGLRGVDAWDTSVGADIAALRYTDRIVYFRGGARFRTLPFQAAGANVSEKSVSGGMGTNFANGHVLTDFALIRSARDAAIGASEKAWTVSIGISVRP